MDLMWSKVIEEFYLILCTGPITFIVKYFLYVAKNRIKSKLLFSDWPNSTVRRYDILHM